MGKSDVIFKYLTKQIGINGCMQHGAGIIDLLLKHGARDSDCKALFVAVQAKDDVIIAKLLALKSHLDPENKSTRKPDRRVKGEVSAA